MPFAGFTQTDSLINEKSFGLIFSGFYINPSPGTPLNQGGKATPRKWDVSYSSSDFGANFGSTLEYEIGKISSFQSALIISFQKNTILFTESSSGAYSEFYDGNYSTYLFFLSIPFKLKFKLGEYSKYYFTGGLNMNFLLGKITKGDLYYRRSDYLGNFDEKLFTNNQIETEVSKLIINTTIGFGIRFSEIVSTEFSFHKGLNDVISNPNCKNDIYMLSIQKKFGK